MLEYLLKSSACLAILLLFYRIFLENERMHTFKRFYLLGSLILSLIIPLLVFVEYVSVPIPEKVNALNTPEVPEILKTQEAYTPAFDFTMLLWPVYCIGLVVFGFKFIQNLGQLLKRIRKNPKKEQERCTHVFIREKMPPHTFLKFIFLNRQQLENQEIPEEVLVHEETHVVQKHSWDVLFIELLQVAFWFNPLMAFFKKAIKLNHEFLADQAVLSKDVDATSYQHTLLAFSSADNSYFQPALPNAINYSSIKKRLTVMKTKTSHRSMLIRSLLLLPLISLLLYSFSTKKVVEKSSAHPTQIEGIWLTKETENYAFTIIRKGNSYVYDNGNGVLPIRKSQGKYYLENRGHSVLLNMDKTTRVLTLFHQEFILEDQSLKKQFEGHWETKKGNTQLHIQNFTDSFIWKVTVNGATNKFYPKKSEHGFTFTYGNDIWSFEVKTNRLVDNKGQSYYRKSNKEVTTEPSNHIKKNAATRVEMQEYKVLAKKYEDNKTGKERILLSEIRQMQELYHKMSDKQKQDVASSIKTPGELQQSATRKQMAEYNKLAKYYNEMPKNNMRIKSRDVARLTYIYSIMSEKQRKDAEPFPSFPEPPLPPKAPKGVEIKAVPPPPPPPDMEIMEVPAPPSPVEHVKKMATQGAIFYYEGKQIDSEKAIHLVTTDHSLNIDSRGDSKNGKPVVKISKDPIIIRR